MAKKFSIGLILLLFALSSFAQKKYMKRAIAAGGDYENAYSAYFNKPIKKQKIQNWCDANGYKLLKCEKGQLTRFGDITTGIVSVRFMSLIDYEERVKRRNAMIIAAHENDGFSINIDWKKAALFIAAGKGVWEAGKWALNKLPTPSSENHSSMGRTSNYKYDFKIEIGEWKENINFFQIGPGSKWKELKIFCPNRSVEGSYSKVQIGVTKSDEYLAWGDGDLLFEDYYDSFEEALKAVVEHNCE